MLKSVFAKYETAFVTIITSGFAVLLLVIAAIVSNSSAEAKSKLMETSAQLIASGTGELTRAKTPEDFSSAVSGEDGGKLEQMIGQYAGENELDVFLCSADGVILRAVGDMETETAFRVGNILPDALLAEKETEETFDLSDDGGSFRVCVRPIRSADGTMLGMTVVTSENIYWLHTVDDLTQTVVISALLVLFASLLSAYVITERTIGPLRQMSRVARNFAVGNFDGRVEVRGRDEVAELAEAFNQMAESLSNLDKLRNSFVASVSHDLRSPMTTIAGFIDGIRDGVIPPEEQDHYLEIVSMEIRRLSRLVNTLLDLSRIQAGDRKFVMKPFDICEMARVILISFEKQIDEKKLEISFESTTDRMTVNADHDAIYQVFYNICHNAVKFSKEGGALRVTVSETKEKKILVSVYNEGQGIPKEDLPMVFERFYKTDKSRGLDKTGVGLGLYISKTIINAHGEKIRVDSEEGKYCEFSFTLPRAPHGILHPAEQG